MRRNYKSYNYVLYNDEFPTFNFYFFNKDRNYDLEIGDDRDDKKGNFSRSKGALVFDPNSKK